VNRRGPAGYVSLSVTVIAMIALMLLLSYYMCCAPEDPLVEVAKTSLVSSMLLTNRDSTKGNISNQEQSNPNINIDIGNSTMNLSQIELFYPNIDASSLRKVDFTIPYEVSRVMTGD